MIDLDTIVYRLQDRSPNKISIATGLTRQTITNIRDKNSKNPEYETMKKLSDYFENQENEIIGDLHERR